MSSVTSKKVLLCWSQTAITIASTFKSVIGLQDQYEQFVFFVVGDNLEVGAQADKVPNPHGIPIHIAAFETAMNSPKKIFESRIVKYQE